MIYYTKNPYFLYYYYKIYKLLEDIIIEIAKRALKNPLKELLGGRLYKKKENYTVNKAPKKYKA
jgi:hypothetical protein